MAGGGGARLNRWFGSEAPAGRPEGVLPVRGTVKSTPVTGADGSVYVAGADGRVRSFDTDGRLRWEQELAGGVKAAPALDDSGQRLFVGTVRGEVVALSAGTGELCWRAVLPTESDPRILSDLLWVPGGTDGWLWVSSWAGAFIELEAGEGRQRSRWSAGMFPQSAAAATEAGEVFFLRAVERRGVELVRVAQGEAAVWDWVPEGARGARRTLVAAGPVVAAEQGVVVAAANRDRDARLVAVGLADGRCRWETALPACVGAPLAVGTDGAVYVADLAGQVSAIDPEGRLRWRTDTGCEYLLAGPVVDGAGNVWVGDPWGRLLQITPEGRCRAVHSWQCSIEAAAGFDPLGRLRIPVSRVGIAIVS